MKLYKLTDKNGRTQNNIQWGKKITHSIPLEKQSKNLCTNGLLHAYKDIRLALLLNPIHANIFPFQLWEAKGDNIIAEDWGKVGCYSLTIIRKISLPDWYQDIKIRKRVQILFAILCAEAVLIHYEKFNPTDKRPHKAIHVAKNYLNNKTAEATLITDAAIEAYKAAEAAADVAVYAAEAAAEAAYAAADVAYAAEAAADVAYAANAADYAAYAANAAAYAAIYTADVNINFVKLAKLAVQKIIIGGKI